MGLFRSMGARKDAVRGTAPVEVRKGLANLFTGPGVLPGSFSPLVVGTNGWTYWVDKAGFVTTRGASDGVHLFGNDGAVSIGATGAGSTVPAAPGAGLSRIDIIWVRHPAAGENADTISEPSFGVSSGTTASTPLPPAIPAGALELARNTMTSAAVNTASTGNSITQTAAKASLRPPETAGWIAYTPVWSSSGIAPVLGNGTLTGKFRRQPDGTVHYRIYLLAGSTTTFGSGNYVFSLPTAAVISGSLSTAGVATAIIAATRYSGATIYNSTSSLMMLFGSTTMTPTTPGVFASTNYVSANGTYESV